MEDQTPPPHASEDHSAVSATALRQLEDRARSALAASREQASRLEADITGQLEAIAASLATECAAESENTADAERLRTEAERLGQELEASRAAWEAARSALEAEREELSGRVSQLEAERQALQHEWKQQVAEFEQKLAEQQAAWSEQRTQWSDERAALESERDELQQKFELALEDVQRFRDRAAELEQDLARRPETSETDSAELVALRAERDALSARVDELERQPSHPIDADAEQQVADLQRRFELAVEDVRELKTKNAQLEAQLAEAGKQAGGPIDSGGMDWESQKRRLLASLADGEEDQDDPEQRQERITIQDTIEMTDAIVAEKDREIAELKSQLEAGGNDSADADIERNQQINELVDADEVIAEHRKRAAQLEREMEEKLRATELEVSVERAKIARHRVELEDLRAELESQRNALGANNGAAPGSGAPRRRWLSKLGLSGDEI